MIVSVCLFVVFKYNTGRRLRYACVNPGTKLLIASFICIYIYIYVLRYACLNLGTKLLIASFTCIYIYMFVVF